ncbi:MAG: sulfotransferase domain-containing protein [Pseudomonadota bacterium]
MSGIIWLASYPKSGNTWTRAFLANYMSNASEPIPINDLPNYILGDGFKLHYEQLTGKAFADLSDDEVNELRPRLHQWFAMSRGETVFVKTHSMITKVKEVPTITPTATAGAIYIVRNPLDVAVSSAYHYQTSFEQAVETLCETQNSMEAVDRQAPVYLGSWSGHFKSWTNAPGLRLHLLRYEDMLQKPVKAFGSIIKFLGLPKEPDRLKRAIRFASFKELTKQESATEFVEARPDGKSKFFRQGKIGGWRDFLTDEQSQKLIDINRAEMTQLGYLSPKGRLKGI